MKIVPIVFIYKYMVSALFRYTEMRGTMRDLYENKMFV